MKNATLNRALFQELQLRNSVSKHYRIGTLSAGHVPSTILLSARTTELKSKGNTFYNVWLYREGYQCGELGSLDQTNNDTDLGDSKIWKCACNTAHLAHIDTNLISF